MNRINWRFAVLPDLGESAAPRVLSSDALINMITVHRPNIAKPTILSVINDLVAISAIRQISADLFLNQRCDPPALPAEAANHIRKDAVLSLQSALYEGGVIHHRQDSFTAVLPATHLKVWDKEFIYLGQSTFEFHILPSDYFPPILGDREDVMDKTKPYPCFTCEKALLDWLFLEKSRNADLPKVNHFDLKKLNMERLFELSARMNLRYLLERFLSQRIEKISSISVAEAVPTPGTIRTNIARIPRILNSLREIWEHNPELSFCEILTEICPRESTENFPKLEDAEWEDGLAAFRR
ncbi:hypothetical protein ABC383_15675 [Noviherbaspirillum sp. 1P10PC]|uniref:hypothetical protein n=1 Tax=Noviherbaspirillum sp. 1P10PC TaxID=3132292 RepID=UPI0039A381F1